MRILSTAGGTVRHGVGAAVEAAVVVAIAVTLIFGAAVVSRHDPAGAASVYAAKGGNGGGHHGAATSGAGAATLTSSCNPCPAGTIVHVSGAGYDPAEYKAVMNYAGAVTQIAVAPDGTIDQDWPFFTVPGMYTVEAWQSSNGGKFDLMASLTIEIQ